MLSHVKQRAKQKYAEFEQRYEIEGNIGEGAYGIVKRAREKSTNAVVAIKTFRSKLSREGEGIPITVCREINLLKELDHRNIVKVKEVVLHIDSHEKNASTSQQHQQQHTSHRHPLPSPPITGPSLMMVFDYHRLDLEKILKYHNKQHKYKPDSRPDSKTIVQIPRLMDQQVLKSIIQQLLEGVKYLHENGILHRDIKPANILIHDDKEECGVVKLADFGLARVFSEPLKELDKDGVVVTIWYRAPELLLGAKHYTPAIDMWAVGCIFAELLSTIPLFRGQELKPENGQGPPPFQSHQLQVIFQILGLPQRESGLMDLPGYNLWEDYVKKNGIHLSPPKDALSNQLRTMMAVDQHKDGSTGFTNNQLDLIKKMLDYNPNSRITAAKALEHDYFKEEPKPLQNAFTFIKKKYVYPEHSISEPKPPAPQQHSQQQVQPQQMFPGSSSQIATQQQYRLMQANVPQGATSMRQSLPGNMQMTNMMNPQPHRSSLGNAGTGSGLKRTNSSSNLDGTEGRNVKKQKK